MRSFDMSCMRAVRIASRAAAVVALLLSFATQAAEPAPRGLEAEQGVVCRLPGERFGYFGWPTIARMDDGTLMVVSSGLRAEHVCPFGKTVLNVSRDDGRTWSPPRVIQDASIDDRDGGIVNLGGKSVLASWFRSDTRNYAKEDWIPAAERETWSKVFANWTDDVVTGLVGSWTSVSDDGGETWSVPRWVGFSGSPPHLVRHSSGALVMTYGYRAKPFGQRVATSRDEGKSWQGDWILRADGPDDDLGYPSTVELGDGSLLTVCYQKAAPDEKCSLLWSKWKLPAAKPVTPVAIGSRRELFVDHSLIESLNGTTLKLHEPVSGGTAIAIDKPWEGPANFGMSVIELDGRLLMYYRGWPANDPKDENGVGCVAESRDGGATWTKPALGLVKRPDWPGNNIIATVDGEPRFVFPCAPFVDTRPGVPAGERVKMIESVPVSGEKHTAMTDPKGPKRLVFWASADGYSFRKLDPQPDFVSDLRNSFDGGNTLFWSEAEGQYVLFYRWKDGEWGQGRRSMARATSKDFMTWTKPVPMTYGDSPREQFYVNNTQPYFRAPHLYLAPAARFMEGRQVLDEARGTALEINYRTGAAGSVRVEIQDLDGTPLAGFAAADSAEIIGDEIERVVTWKVAAGKPPADLGKLAGKPVRLRFILADADVFSFRFR